jgi:anaerobic dimethyl sulfoxide reductase subunit B (iron-sulfur subunit)
MNEVSAQKQWGFFFDQSRCSGCFTCILACRQWHHSGINWRRVETMEKGAYPHVTVAFLSLSCLHCGNPACVTVCPADALRKRSADGIVQVDDRHCLGRDTCGQCLDACPYKAIGFRDEPDAKAEKCDFCLQRITQDEKPLCVVSCPTRALDAGPLAQLKEKFGDRQEAKGFRYDRQTRPSIVFKCKIQP